MFWAKIALLFNFGIFFFLDFLGEAFIFLPEVVCGFSAVIDAVLDADDCEKPDDNNTRTTQPKQRESLGGFFSYRRVSLCLFLFFNST